ncbi:olfactory receptor 13C2-like [Sander lucioperca]|uniref:olfactory receptor 13C2-like n=1 Tax=Sander lucioperca TaxID=283035 RepID=UPI00125E91B8|nr:olfactory receptor 13C2-like [Sander lucioperca]
MEPTEGAFSAGSSSVGRPEARAAASLTGMSVRESLSSKERHQMLPPQDKAEKSNSTIVGTIVMNKALHEPMYIFIAALLINSVLYSTVIYPKLLIDFLSEKQIISYSACIFQWFIYYTLGISEFFLLSVMSYDRYVSICKPLQYPTIMTKKTVYMFLILAWILPACQMSVGPLLIANEKLCYFILKGITCNSTVQKLQCVTSTVANIYGLILFVESVPLPVLFILFTYTRILIIIYRSSREVRRKAAQTCLPHLLVLINFSCLSAYDEP